MPILTYAMTGRRDSLLMLVGALRTGCAADAGAVFRVVRRTGVVGVSLETAALVRGFLVVVRGVDSAIRKTRVKSL